MAHARPAYLISPDELAANLCGMRILDARVIFAPTPEGGFTMETGR